MRPEQEDAATLERRVQATQAVRQVVNALWALSRAQLPRVEVAAAEAVAFLAEVERVVTRLATPPDAPPSAETLHVVLGPERGWCGPLARELLAQVPEEGELALVGHRLHEVALTDPSARRRVRFWLPGAVTPEDTPEVAREVARSLLAHLDVAHVELWHPVGGSSRLRSTLVLGGPGARRHDAPSTLSPWDTVLRAAVFEAITAQLTVAVVEALHSELRARAVAAEQARHAAEKRLEVLERELRAARQQEITTELVELVAGRAAMLGRH